MLDLCKAIHAYSNQPTFVSSFEMIPPVSIHIQDEKFLFDNFHKLLPPKARLVGGNKSDWTFAPSALAKYYFWDVSTPSGMPRYIKENPSSGLEDLTISGGTVRSSSGCGVLSLGDLTKVKFSRLVRVHWFLKDYRVAFALNKSSEERFLSGLAKATCSKLVSTSKEYFLDTDPEVFRRQWVRRLEKEREAERVAPRKERIGMSISFLNGLNRTQLLSVLSKPAGWVHIDLANNKSAIQLAQRYVNSYLEWCQQNQKKDGNAQIFIMSYSDSGGFDWSKGCHVQVSYPDVDFILHTKQQPLSGPKRIVRF